jgi:hypothetical protein
LELCQRAFVSWAGFVATRCGPVYQNHAVALARDYTEPLDQQGMAASHRIAAQISTEHNTEKDKKALE